MTIAFGGASLVSHSHKWRCLPRCLVRNIDNWQNQVEKRRKSLPFSDLTERRLLKWGFHQSRLKGWKTSLAKNQPSLFLSPSTTLAFFAKDAGSKRDFTTGNPSVPLWLLLSLSICLYHHRMKLLLLLLTTATIISPGLSCCCCIVHLQLKGQIAMEIEIKTCLSTWTGIWKFANNGYCMCSSRAHLLIPVALTSNSITLHRREPYFTVEITMKMSRDATLISDMPK